MRNNKELARLILEVEDQLLEFEKQENPDTDEWKSLESELMRLGVELAKGFLGID